MYSLGDSTDLVLRLQGQLASHLQLFSVAIYLFFNSVLNIFIPEVGLNNKKNHAAIKTLVMQLAELAMVQQVLTCSPLFIVSCL